MDWHSYHYGSWTFIGQILIQVMRFLLSKIRTEGQIGQTFVFWGWTKITERVLIQISPMITLISHWLLQMSYLWTDSTLQKLSIFWVFRFFVPMIWSSCCDDMSTHSIGFWTTLYLIWVWLRYSGSESLSDDVSRHTLFMIIEIHRRINDFYTK